MADRTIDSQTNEVEVTKDGVTLRRTIAHLPAFYRTDVNDRFLSSTLDQLIQPGKLDRLDGFVGRKDAYTNVSTDKYIESGLKDRDDYQLEPTVTYIKKDSSSINPEDQVKFTATYDDYINQIKFFGGNVDNHDRLNSEKIYSWNPSIDFDKLINYREYYWLPEGPNPILITNSGPNTVTEIQVTHRAQEAYLFSTYPKIDNPTITLYRGNTYKFLVDASGHPFSIMTEPFKTGVSADDSTSLLYSTGVSGNGVEQGVLTFTVPTRAPDVLYYQCGSHAGMNGAFTIKTVTDTNKIDVLHEIVGTKNYTLPSGTKLSNGMKLRFDANVTNTDYANKQFYVEGVGSAITLTDTANLIVSGSYAEQVTEPYDDVPYADRPYAVSFYRPVNKDYITIKRDSIDGNAWSAYNRWFHRATIEATAEEIGYTPNLLEEDRAKRPIIEFDAGLSLYDHGTSAKRPVTLVDNTTTDVFSKMVNQTGYIVDGVPLKDGMRLLVLADRDPLVNNKIYLVNFVRVADREVTTLKLTADFDGRPADGDTVSVEMGTNYQGKTWYFNQDQNIWVQGQSKTRLNQAPLFQMFDDHHTPYDDATAYVNSTFTGSKLFEYKISDTAPVDPVLGLQIKYNTIQNVGDIVFTSDYSTDSFEYQLNGVVTKKNFNTGHYHQVLARDEHISRIGWLQREEESKQRVVRLFTVTDATDRAYPIDVFLNSKSLSDLSVVVEVNHVVQNLEDDYDLVDGLSNKFVQFTSDLKLGDIVKIIAHSSAPKVKDRGLYEVPENLSVNPFNAQLEDFTYGQILNHLNDINEKNTEIVGSTPGNSNLRDLPDVRTKGGTIIKHGSPLPQAMFLLIDPDANAIKSIEYCAKEYQRFKEAFLKQTTGKAHEGSIADRVDEIIKTMSANKDKSFPFYYEDMIGFGESVRTRNYTVQSSEQTEYAIESQFDITQLSNRAVYVYLNDAQLILGSDYTFSTDSDGLTISTPLVEGDKVVIKDYANTEGSFIPSTPTKLGLYPKFKPELITDNTYRTSTTVLVGHDGSRTIAFGDYRDDLLLELEKRIYNNCKTAYDPNLLAMTDVVPGAFRTTNYTPEEINSILSLDFYGWTGANGVDYQANDQYDENDHFTFNYRKNKNVLSGKPLPGNWRGIYKHFYDTDRPHTHPWEMLGYSEKPNWWESNYGPTPYTAGNDLLWNHLETGYDVNLKTSVEKYKRTGLSNYIPVDDSGNLRSPVVIGLTDTYQNLGIQDKWSFGDQGPAETAWRRSSHYPFAVMKLLALTKPAKFFTYFLDNSKIRTNLAGNIINTDTKLAPTLSGTNFYLDTSNVTSGYVRAAGYQPFIVNYLIKCGLDPAIYFYDKLKGLSVQLAYKLGGFTDKENLRVLTDSISPSSTAGSQFIPEENYKIVFRASNPVETFEYSGVLIELNSAVSGDGNTLEGGYKVIGYNTHKPYFKVRMPVVNNKSYEIRVGNSRAVIYQDWSETEIVVPYGTVFKNTQSVVDFLVGYGKHLEAQGFVFDRFSKELKEIQNWETSAKEFLYWTRQGWAAGSAITLSPAADGFMIETTESIISKFNDMFGQYSILTANGQPLEARHLSTKRIGNKFSIAVKNTEEGIYNISMNAVQKEHIVLFDNITVFSDIIYQLVTGFRQQRLKLIGWKTGDWHGDYYSPGFIFDEAKVDRWTANTDYHIGDTVEYGNYFYVAKNNHNSGNAFDYELWTRKLNKPAAQLIPNFDYKISQFNDFYSLETNNFDENQQKLAQHLIGYQSRPYLDNLFLNDVSQYKFYQGFIREKGTLNAIQKLLKAKFYGENIDLKVYPEWMIKTGEFGSLDQSKIFQFIMEDDNFTNTVQSIELLNNENSSKTYSRSAAVYQDDMYSKPLEYTAENTFKKYDYTQQGYDRDVIQTYKTAGFPRLFDVQHTAFNESDLLNLDVTQIANSDLIWIAKKANHDWDVQRITYKGISIISVGHQVDDNSTVFTFNNVHRLEKNQYIAIVNSSVSTLNRVYQVKEILSQNAILVDASIETVSLSTINPDESTMSTFGLLYSFISVRMSALNDTTSVLPYNEYRIADDVNQTPGDKIFVDNVGSKWKIYEKTDPYVYKRLGSIDPQYNQEFGYQTVSTADGKFLIVSAPGNRADTESGISAYSQGVVYIFTREEPDAGTPFQSVRSFSMTDSDTGTGRLGESLSLSTDENFITAGAPYANILSSDGSTRISESGIVHMYVWSDTLRSYEEFTKITAPESDQTAGLQYGWAHVVAEPTENSNRATRQKYLLVSAPGYNNDTGVVYIYTYDPVGDSTASAWTQDNVITSDEAGSGKRFGHRMSINDNGDILAVSSTSSGDAGTVEIFVRSDTTSGDSTLPGFTHVQTLRGIASEDSTLNTAFGDSISMSDDGKTLVIGAPGVDKELQADAGAIYIYKWDANNDSTQSYTLTQTILSPDTATNMQFGSSVHINKAATRIVIGARGFDNTRDMLFDGGLTTFDLQDTQIVDLNARSGGVFTANKYNDDFLLDGKIVTTNVSPHDKFGNSVFVTDDIIFVGAPNDDTTVSDDSTRENDGMVGVFDLKTANQYSWKVVEQEKELVDNRLIESAFIFDRAVQKIQGYLDYYDPIKGRILGLADREINYKTEWDPAVYDAGTDDKTVQSTQSWAESHIGEVWWDLSKCRWLWYEQGDQEYKTKNWGKLFPGSSIDVYEWVESILTPAQWAVNADTTDGLARRISGQPLHGDNTVYSVRQKYNSRLDGFINYYYFWVKNSVFLPDPGVSAVTRKNTTAYVSNIISNPLASGIRYFTVSDINKLITFNLKYDLINSNSVLSITHKDNDGDVTGDAHYVWKLIKEGDRTDRPNAQIEKKWWDSLTGQDEVGNQVPDLDTPIAQRYGNKIRPRQSWYTDRFSALKEIIDYSNSVLLKYQLANNIRYNNLNAIEPEPKFVSGEWDEAVDTYADLTYIDTRDISGTFNVLVHNDEQFDQGYWSIYNWTGTEWLRTRVQTYKTNSYYEQVDWYAQSYDANKIIEKQIQYQYQLELTDVSLGDYVKVLTADTGGWKIFEKTKDEFVNIATENGTIQLKTSLYDYTVDATGYAGQDPFDASFFDREPQLELRNILKALRDDLFVDELSVEYNNIFFIGLRKVFEQQQYVDWLVRTSFINVSNTLRELDQRKNYRVNTENYVEEYINEVKPFHSKIREYRLGYTGRETQDGIYTDFDLPAFYDGNTIRNIDLNTDILTLNTYPYRFWRDNYKKYVTEIDVVHGGSGYVTAPTVTLVGGTTKTVGPFTVLGTSTSGSTSGSYGYFYPLYTAQIDANVADGQAGGSSTSDKFTFSEFPGIDFYMPTTGQNTGKVDRPSAYDVYTASDVDQATAKATIREGAVVRITLLTSGSNYTATPRVVLTGGGDNGTTPSDTARAYAVLRNDLVRDLSTTIKFDRVQSTATVLTWTANTAYAYNDLIRYENSFYKVTTGYTSNDKFDEGLSNLVKLRGDEPYITAAERTLGFYTPTAGMPGNELSQVMTGVDYGGVMVTGLAFDNSQGWDASPWYDLPWDGYGLSRVKVFYGDGSTTQFTFDVAPTALDVYTIYFTDISDSSGLYPAAVANVNRKRQVSQVIRGDGSTTTFTIVGDNGSPAPANTYIELIPFEEDGVATPTDDKTLDSLVSGGLFKSALGISPSDIIVEGDAFLTPETSYSPEENLPGSIFDTVDIKVYQAPESGTPFILTKNFLGDASTTTFNLGKTPGTLASVVVSLDGVTQRLNTDYTVNVSDQTVTFTSTPSSGAVISLKTFAISGLNYMIHENFTGDGSTSIFVSSSRETYQFDSSLSQLYVTIDGVPTTDYTYTVSDKELSITVTSTPASDSLIQVASFNKSIGSGKAQTEIRSQEITYNSSNLVYTLSYPAGAIGPYSSFTILEHQGKVLRGPDNTYYTGDGSTSMFSFIKYAGATEGDSTLSGYRDTISGETRNIINASTTVNSFPKTTYHSVWYLGVTLEEISGELATAKYSLVHNDTNAFVSTTSITPTGIENHITTTADIDAGTTVRLLGTGASTLNSASWYRIGLGDNTVSNTIDPNLSTLEVTPVTSSGTTLDSFGTASYRGAKYYLSVNEIGSTKRSNIEVSVTHNGTDAYISSYNVINTDSALLTVTANIVGSDVVVTGTAVSNNVEVNIYRVILGDSEVSNGSTLIGATTVDSSSTLLDSFVTANYTGAHYIVSVWNPTESASSLYEVTVVGHNGNAFVSATGVNSKGSTQLQFSADMSGSTISLNATSTSGSGTIINAYRVGLLRNPGGAVIDPNKVRVYVNGAKKDLYSDYTVDIDAKTVNLTIPPAADDLVVISTIVGTHYYDKNDQIILQPDNMSVDGIILSHSDTINAITFNNAAGMNQRREIFAGETDGEFELFGYPVNNDYTFVWLNGESLVQNYDWTLSGNLLRIPNRTFVNTDRIDVMYFDQRDNLEGGMEQVGWRIFKDMLNRTFYKRLNLNESTTLARALEDTDTSIIVANGDVLTPVDGSTQLPGVIYIGNERIEYFYKSGNTLSNIRRGTLGTAIKSHSSSARVIDASGKQTIPYADTVYTKKHIADGETTRFISALAVSSPYEIDLFVGGHRVPYRNEDSSTNYTVHTWDDSTANIELTTRPASGVEVKIIQKKGRIWYDQGDGVATNGLGFGKSDTPQARFIRQGTGIVFGRGQGRGE